MNAMEVGHLAADSDHIVDLERAHVVHEAQAASAVVLTYEPDQYRDHTIDVVDLRPDAR